MKLYKLYIYGESAQRKRERESVFRESLERETMARDGCLARVTAGVAVGGAVGGAVGAVYGTYEAIRYKVPGLLKIRYIGQTTLGSAAIFGLFLGAGSLIHCGKSY
ncbi:hypothetical protein RHMOL_Rhmol01G0264800 [Rhododendron molle]|uniref:Uncharacterized protein n=2 Tax=Ericaceae TaxID=4345 RepID=A0ACC0Q737_RHOML|nr:hypothetical protein RHMOL_Rhmol01G0264800 [Rhododendron molle]